MWENITSSNVMKVKFDATKNSKSRPNGRCPPADFSRSISQTLTIGYTGDQF